METDPVDRVEAPATSVSAAADVVVPAVATVSLELATSGDDPRLALSIAKGRVCAVEANGVQVGTARNFRIGRAKVDGDRVREFLACTADLVAALPEGATVGGLFVVGTID